MITQAVNTATKVGAWIDVISSIRGTLQPYACEMNAKLESAYVNYTAYLNTISCLILINKQTTHTGRDSGNIVDSGNLLITTLFITVSTSTPTQIFKNTN